MTLLRHGQSLFASVLFAGVGVFLAWRGLFVQRPAISSASHQISRIHLYSESKAAEFCAEDASAALPTLPKLTKKTILVLIDALRFDFVLNAKSPLHRVIQTLKQQQDSFLKVFLADPPTTTSQRLEGIFSGVYPTFLDAVRNFDPEATQLSDNVVDSLWKAHPQTCYFYGDKTWLDIFQSLQADGRSAGFHSFDMFDLHHVDNLILQHMKGFVEKEDQEFAFLGLHFLGLDHAGHTFSASHPQIHSKLQQYSAFIEEELTKLGANSPETTLIVFGDHGMTESGDHGGESWNEVASVLFWHTNAASERFGSFKRRHAAFFAALDGVRKDQLAVRQIDFANTFAVVHGLPLPRQSVGGLIPEIVLRHLWEVHSADEDKMFAHLLDAIRLALHNIKIHTWPALQCHLNAHKKKEFQALFDSFDQLEADGTEKSTPKNSDFYKAQFLRCFEISQRITQKLKSHWNSIHYPLILAGIVFMGAAAAVLGEMLRLDERLVFLVAVFVSIFYISNSQIENEHILVKYLVGSLFLPSVFGIFEGNLENAFFLLVYPLLHYKEILGSAKAWQQLHCIAMYATAYLLVRSEDHGKERKKRVLKCLLLAAVALLEGPFGKMPHFYNVQRLALGACLFVKEDLTDLLQLVVTLLQRPLEGAASFLFLALCKKLLGKKETDGFTKGGLLGLLGWMHCFLTDHSSHELSKLQWDRAFFGCSGFSYYQNIVNVFFNSLCCFVLPLVLAEKGSQMACVVAVECVKMLGCAVCCFVNGRHLMAYAIFIPRFLLQIGVFLVCAGGWALRVAFTQVSLFTGDPIK